MPASVSDLPQIADSIGADLAAATQAGVVRDLGQMFARTGLAAHLVTEILKEARLKSPRKKRLAGYYALLSATLECLRLDMNGGRREATESLEFTSDYLAGAVERGGVEPDVLVEIGRAFAFARIPPPEALRRTLGALTDQRVHGDARRAGSLDDMPDIFAGLGDDCFAIHDEMLASSAAYPQKHRFAIAAGLAMSASAGARAAAIGFLLDADAELAGMLAMFLAEKGPDKPVDSRTVERLIRLRPWLAPARQPPIDAALKVLRKHALPPSPTAASVIETPLVTPVDGAGAQSMFVLVRQGRKLALASILVKLEDGVVDAWTLPDLTRKRAREMLDQIRMEAGALPVSRAYIEARTADALTCNLRKTPPPFGLIQALETIGAGAMIPEAIDAAAMLAGLTQTHADAAAARDTIERTFADPILDTWFEAGEDVDVILSPIRGRKKRVAALLEEYLPVCRAAWMTRLAWTARAICEANPQDPRWTVLAQTAQQLAAGAAPAEIALMQMIAERSVDAYSSMR
jgi:hypothetical protein